MRSSTRLATLVILAAVTLTIVGCPTAEPPERITYRTIVGAKGFLDGVKANHPLCINGAVDTNSASTGTAAVTSYPAKEIQVCTMLYKGIAAKDTLISAWEVYCGGAQFDAGGACQPPDLKTDVGIQAARKLNTALQGYNQTEASIKKLIGQK